MVFVGRKKEIEDFRSAVNSLMEGGQVRLVVGAAGYGKSELLKEFERRCKEDEMIIENGEVIVIRDEFSRSDDPLSFLSRIKDAWLREVNPKSMGIIGWIKKHRPYLEGAIDAVAKGASLVSPAGGLISSMKIGLPSLPDLPQNAGFLLQAFIADLAEFHKYNPNKRLVLLLDEYHKISNEDIFNAMFNDIIDNMQNLSNVMIVIASRKQLRNSDAIPLALFEENETESFLKENLGIDDRTLIGDAQRLLRGHPYSLGMLLLISKEKKTNIEDIIGNLPETKVDDYLHTEFFDHLEKEIQRFLRKVCVLQILDEHACTFVIQSEEYDATVCSNMLLQLQRLMLLDELGKVNRIRLFRLHDLFRDFLMAMNEASLPELHNRAAEYYLDIIEKQGDKGTDISVVRFALYHLQESLNIDDFVMLLNKYEIELRTLGYVKELLSYYTSIDFEKISEPKIQSDILHDYGIALYLTGEYQQALEKYQKSMEIEEKLGDQRGIAGTLHQIANVHYIKGEYQQALEKYQKSMEIEEKLGDQRGIAGTLHQIANVHYIKGEYQQALEKYQISMEIKEKLGDQRGIAITLHQIAMIHQDKGEYQQALEKYQKSMEINEKLGDQSGIAYTAAQMSLLYSKIGKKEKAIEYTQKALGIFENIGLDNEAMRARAQLEAILES